MKKAIQPTQHEKEFKCKGQDDCHTVFAHMFSISSCTIQFLNTYPVTTTI